ncbi:ABC transporter permease [Steroidobacter sp. S1-65]|uniref:ABC transporter permease n=1 Tax=Steroidobacter gossypii TaxID=2805490 RepID=A0ABS1X6I6_9GAMM|nr:ABC transporter permease [Steroidobacter gossypii]MBM0108841.1 ABC transporter permease [Steroidobacter gossypii]
MFKYLPLLWANLGRKRLRTSLTLASIVVAFLLFGLMQTLRVALTGSPELAGLDRLITMHKTSFIQSLPLAYLNRVKGVDGVLVASSQDWFGGMYQEDRNQLATFAIEAPTFFEVYSEYQLPPEQKQAFLQDRSSAIVGKLVAERFQWKVGDTIPMRSNIWTRKDDGGNVWPLKIAGIYEASNGDNQSIYMHYEYLNESRAEIRDMIGWVVVKVSDPDRSAEIARNIDALFVNSSTETKTSTEKAFIQGFANQMGNIGKLLTMVAAAVFFTMLLVTANTMGQSIRERINEIGVMKTLGFSGRGVTSLVLAEAILVTAIGGLIGLGLAALVSKGLSAAVAQFFPVLGMPAATWGIGAVLIVVLGSLAAALPCAQAGRLKIVDALRKT